ncbi:zinc finger BED domain-containing protein 4-like [Panonychus citri]|uniref:zinc finger BED domain-containing protein 4-like n=1 Tax=Panonychus citri TaxID=50023 RepID=UPI002306E923|nr:zinc finger BED domain-containing protein 4-like [Panonychus citri]XP_053208369.1 zinc finger BED domain-containing protein 4-like [Panonychus citri]XP_053208370.1 zinc finger BED domain-containing protein 4-like [Panonychus citri]
MYKRKPSNVWNYFSTIGDKAQCRLCGKQIKKCGNTSNFLAHLRNIHNLLPHQLSTTSDQAIPASENSHATLILQLEGPEAISEQSISSKRVKTEDDKSKLITNLVASWFAKDMLPEEIAMGDGFKKFLNEVAPHLPFPPQAGVVEKLHTKYQSSLIYIADKLSKVDEFALTFDIWNNNLTQHSHLTLTSHFIDGTSHGSIVIGNRELPSTTISTDELRSAVMDILNKWAINPEKITCAITHDITGLMGSLQELLDASKYQKCFAHTLDSMLRESIGSQSELLMLIRKIRENLHFCDEITAAQESIMRDKVVVLKVSPLDDKSTDESDWTCLYATLERYVSQSTEISNVLMGFDGPVISEADGKIAEETLSLLKPFHQIADEMSSEKWTPISKIIPIVGVLVKAINLILPETNCAKEFKNTLLKNIRSNFKDIEADPIASIATLLDPRFKNLDFTSEAQSVKAVNKLNSMLTSEDGTIEDQVGQGDQKDDDIWCLRRVSRAARCNEQTDSNKIAAELRNYLDHRTFNITSDPIEIWDNHKTLFPSIHKLAKKYLSIPASAIPAERLFTGVGSLVTRKRCLIDSSQMENLLMLESLPADVVFSL